MNNKTPETESFTTSAVIIVPTYNNGTTIKEVIEAVKKYCKDIIVINDGSTDNTSEILNSINTIKVISFPENRGKGAALKEGFKKATELGFTHAITFDGDGQHVTEDITLFLNKINEEPETLWIGNRVLSYGKGEKQPVRSSFGRKFGNFWYKYFTDIKLHDTQCGLRAYPLEGIMTIKCRGKRYEYEQDLLIRSAWNGISVKEIDIHLLYLPKGKEVSHFKPVRDFLLISKINSIAGITKALNPVTSLEVPGKTWREKIKFLAKRELKTNTSPQTAALSVAMGVFMGILPIHFFQVITLMVICFKYHLNRPLAFLGVNVSSAPFLPLLFLITIPIGRLVLPPDLITFLNDSWIQRLCQYGAEFFVGSAILCVPAGIVTYMITYPMFKQLAKADYFKKRGMFK
jgi:glycosyltransferase involved in cell wall biosynthesis